MREDRNEPYVEAQRRIKAWREGNELNLGLPGLDRLPPEIGDLEKLQALNFWTVNSGSLPLRDLSPLSNLHALKILDCSRTQVSDLSPLSDLSALTSLSFSRTPVSNLGPIVNLRGLTHLVCSRTQISDLYPLSRLNALTNLDCFGTQVSDLSPLSGLRMLARLDCARTQVSDLRPLVSLRELTHLACFETKVSDLSALEGFLKLRSLRAQKLKIDKPPARQFWFLEPLEEVSLQGSNLPGAPAEILAERNCLPALRAHFADLGEEPSAPVVLELEGRPIHIRNISTTGTIIIGNIGAASPSRELHEPSKPPEFLEEARLLILGNGRIGKTQLRRRLRGEAYDPSIPFTHGIVVSPAPVPGHQTGRFHLWDFGGQEIYHGVHALFLRGRAVILLGWTPESEDGVEDEQEAPSSRNHPLPYWLHQIKALAGPETPLLIVQTRCDDWTEERALSPEAQAAAEPFRRKKLLAFSAAKDRGRGALEEILAEAYALLDKPPIGRGRAAVKREIERRIAEDAARPPQERRHRTMSRAEFEALCARTGGISDPGLFLRFLNDCGVVAHLDDLSGGRVLLDQNWALEAIYALFERGRVHKALKGAGGRFTLQDLGEYLWDEQGHTLEDQRLFLNMMRACGICFPHHGEGDQAVHIAPDLLPERPSSRVEEIWEEREPEAEAHAAYPIAPGFILRGLICAIGEQAKLEGEYWRSGLHLYDKSRKSRLRVEVLPPQEGEGWSIGMKAQGPHAADLLTWLEEKLAAVEARFGLAIERRPDWKVRLLQEPSEPAAPVYARDPRLKPQIYVSYAWSERDGSGPDREARVEEFCEMARAKGYEVIRDKERMGYGDDIPSFMARLASAERVAVFLSATYLESAFCMKELHGVWTESRRDPEEFWKRARVWMLKEEPPAIRTPEERLECAAFWKQRHEKLDALLREHGPELMSSEDHADFKAMGEFKTRTSDILTQIMRRVKPTTLEDLLRGEAAALLG